MRFFEPALLEFVVAAPGRDATLDWEQEDSVECEEEEL
jgi:hypothetical protein